jgi:peptidoglycan L-alanyl-D-glutamate endopeptidase CwlK
MESWGLLSLVTLLGAVICLLSWIGWRFFVVAGGEVGVAARKTKAPVEMGSLEVQRHCLPEAGAYGARHWSLAGVLLVGGGVVGGVLLFSERIVPEPLLAMEMERQAHIQGALNPERLVPPPALPPSLFIGSERPALETADRDWGRLNPGFVRSVLIVLARLEERGYSFALLEGYRSPERQDKLADMGSHVTNARAFQSKHQFGMAADLAPLRDGRLLISERDPWAMQAYVALGEEAEKAGLVWGGRWWFKDYGHVEVAASVAALAGAKK